jgi:guanylate cyclase
MSHPQRLQSIVLNIVLTVARIGAHPDDSDTVRLQKAIQNNTVIFGSIPVQFTLGVLLTMYGEYAPAAGAYAGATVALLGIIVFGLTRRYWEFFKFLQLAIALLSPFAGTIATGGIVNVGFSIIWGVVAPLLAFILYTPRIAFYWLGAFLVEIAISGLAQPYLRPTNNLPFMVITTIAVINLIGVSTMMVGAFYFFVNQRDLAYRLLNIERDKAENLLLNILPSEIATILKNNNGVIAEHFEGASILFADVVNFTPMSAQMKPVELVELLNEVFSDFDALVEKYGLEKIKTIGDCYMVASGVPRPRPDHAQTLIRMALELREHVRQGDAVNTASRMESHGMGNTIQITKDTYELIKDDFVCEPRGLVNVKGKGDMEVWQVVGAKSDAQVVMENKLV